MTLVQVMESLKINEIFYSIQGESSFAGLPTVFVRLTGCNLRCTYCDTSYAFYEGEFFDLDTLLKQINSYDTPYICITGGEPLLQKSVYPLMKTLCDNGKIVSLETSGSKSCEFVDSRVKIVIDVKTPDSGSANSFFLDNLNFLNVNSEFKFVICSEKDFFWSEDFVKKNDLHSRFSVLFSPSFGKVEEKWLAEKILEKKLKVRLHLQLHKYIWLEHIRGV